MKLAVLITLTVALWAGLTAGALPACRRVCQRREWRDLSPSERDRFVSAIKSLHSRPSPTFGGLSYWEHFARIHEQNAGQVHNSGFFLVWHRLLLYYVEQALQSVDPGVCIPYWDWDQTYNQPEKDEIWKWLGGSLPGRPVPDGPFKDFSVNWPNRHMLTRGFDMNSKVRLYSSSQNDAAIVSESVYGSYSTNVEYSSHGAVHSMIGGDMITMHSNLDPLFYLHHGKVDYLYFQWQSRHDTSFRSIGQASVHGTTISLTTPMPFFTDITVGDVIDPANTCFIYRRRQNDHATGLDGTDDSTNTTSTDEDDGSVNGTSVNGTATGNGTNGTSVNGTHHNGTNGTSVNGTTGNATEDSTDNTTSVDPDEGDDDDRQLVQIDPAFAEMNGFDEKKLQQVQEDMNTFETDIKDGKQVVPPGFFDDSTALEEAEANRLRSLGLEVDDATQDNTTSSEEADDQSGAYAISPLFSVAFAVAVSLLF